MLNEIHDPEFFNNERENLDENYSIYKMDKTKKGFVGFTTSKLLDLALEEIFFRMVIPQDGQYPEFIGRIEPR